MSNPKITFAELEEKLLDIDKSDEELRGYFRANKEHSRAFRPLLEIDSSVVEVSEADEPRVEAGIVGGFINSIARFRRRRKFRRNVKRHPERKIIVSEGDSWFQFPFFLDDVIDQIGSAFNVWSSGAAGDTLQNMILENPEYLDALDDVDGKASAFVFSGGGNDVIGEDDSGQPVLERLVRPFDPVLDAQGHIVSEEADEQFAFIRSCYERMIEDIRIEHPEVPIFIHGYDYVFPGNFSAEDTRDPFYAAKDEWIARPLLSKGITEPAFQREIIINLLDSLNEMQIGMASNFDKVHHVDVRGTVDVVTEWNDEIHPNDNGFAKVGRLFINNINDFS